jgi:Trypsin-like peptidase domain
LNTTIKIVGIRDSLINGKIKSYNVIGTGFYFSFNFDHDTIPVIVTIAHSIRECHTGTLRFKSYSDEKINYGDLLVIKIDQFESKWIKHKTEDLAILPLSPVREEVFKYYQKTPYSVSFSESDIPNDTILNNLFAIEDVLMIGYPKGLSDDSNDLPIVRKGLTATPVYINYKNRDWFLLDIPIYAGSSGSPVCLFNMGTYADKEANLHFSGRLYLLGIAVESNNYTAIGHTTKKDSIPELEVKIDLPFDVAKIIKAKCLLDFKKDVLKLTVHNK